MKKNILSAGLLLVVMSSNAGACDEKTGQVFDLQVTEKGFEPKNIEAVADKCIILKVTRKTDSTCATEIQIPVKKIKKNLPLATTVQIDLGVLKKGETPFGCGMNMMESGKITVK